MTDTMKAKIYIGFDDWKDVESQFQAALGPEPEIIYARYDQGGYDGDANIIFKRGDQWFYVRGGHCSCYGLEGQWSEDLFDPAGHLESVKQGRREISMYDAGEDGRLELDRWIEWHSRPTLRAALVPAAEPTFRAIEPHEITFGRCTAPAADDEVEAIRGRHEAGDDDDQHDGWTIRHGWKAHTDRATLLRHVDRLSAELAKERERVRLFMGAACPVATEINPRGYNWSEAYLDQAHAATITKDTP